MNGGDGPDSNSITGRDLLVVGVGSVGGAAAWMIAGMQPNRLTLVDRGRLRRDNLRRHLGDAASVGCPKVDVVRQFCRDHAPAGGDVPIEALHFDARAERSRMRRLVRHADAVLVAVDDEGLRYHLADAARTGGTPTVFAGVYAGGWACETITEGLGIDRPCYGCASAAMGRIGVPVGPPAEPYVGSPARRVSGIPAAESTSAAVGPLHVQTAAALSVAGLIEILSSADKPPAIAKRMRLPTTESPPPGLGGERIFTPEIVPVRSRTDCLVCGWVATGV